MTFISIYKFNISNRSTSNWSRNRIKRKYTKIIAGQHFSLMEVTEETYLDSEPYKLHNSEIIKDDGVKII